MAILAKLAAEEQRLLAEPVLAPVVAGGRVRVRVSGIVYEMAVEDPSFQGWAVLKMVATGRCRVVGTPTPAQISAYLKLLPRVRLVLLDRHNHVWWGIAAQRPDPKLSLERPAPIQFADRAASFETIYARFDGQTFWFDSVDRRRDPKVARSLRTALQEDAIPRELRVLGMVPQEKEAYRLLWLLKHPELRDQRELWTERDLPESDSERLSKALDHAGAQLDGFWHQGEGNIVVRYVIGRTTHVAQVRSDDLTVLSAGICLAGDDQHFDLTSLVGVMQEYERQEEFD